VIGRQDFLQLLQLLPLLEVPTTLPAPNAAPAFPDAKITDKVFMDIRVSRQDGSFYVRDDLPDTFENRVLSSRLEFGPRLVWQSCLLSYVSFEHGECIDEPNNFFHEEFQEKEGFDAHAVISTFYHTSRP
jgi:hypothetical protein